MPKSYYEHLVWELKWCQSRKPSKPATNKRFAAGNIFESERNFFGGIKNYMEDKRLLSLHKKYLKELLNAL